MNKVHTIAGSPTPPVQYAENAWEQYGRQLACECGERVCFWTRVNGERVEIPCLHCKTVHQINFVDVKRMSFENWREHTIQTIPHDRYRGKKLGDLTELELKILRDSWLNRFGAEELLRYDKNSAKTVPRHLDILNIQEAVKTLSSRETK